ncbi:MAG: peptide-methionine (R)-S-oxide reductase MsrB [Vicinamibacterales bacterium]
MADQHKSDTEWQDTLSPSQYHVLREKGTERAFSGQHWNSKDDGVYCCAGCGQPLFDSRSKFESGTGWPSFHSPAAPASVDTAPDHSHGMDRIEALCSSCGGHLGHVFTDGPKPTGLRYCINSAALDFKKREP